MLVCVKHLTNWPTVRTTPDATDDTVLCFMQGSVLHSCEEPRIVVSDNARCFTARALADFMRNIETTWKAVTSFAPMSNWKAERTVGTNQKGTGHLFERSPEAWQNHYGQAVHGYCCHQLVDGKSPFELLYGVRSRIVGEEVPQVISRTVADQHFEDSAFDGIRASQAVGIENDKKKQVVPIMGILTCDSVLVAYCKAVDSSVKRPAYKPRFNRYLCGEAR